MREHCTYGSEGGEGEGLSLPLSEGCPLLRRPFLPPALRRPLDSGLRRNECGGRAFAGMTEALPLLRRLFLPPVDSGFLRNDEGRAFAVMTEEVVNFPLKFPPSSPSMHM